MKLTRLFPALSVRNYRNYWIMQWIALIGFWIQLTSQQWLVYEMTQSAILLGLLSTMQFLPSLLLTLFTGFLIDRHSKRKILVGTQTLYMLQAFLLACLLWSGHAAYGWILFFAFFIGTIDAIDMPTRLAFLPSLVGKEYLHSAVALNSANFNSTRMFGPLLAAFLLTYIDYGSVFFLNALSLIPICLTYLHMHVEEPKPTAHRKKAWHEIKEGIACARRNPIIMVNLLSMAIVSGLILNFGTYGPLFADRILHRGLSGFGVILFAIGVGSLAGGLLSAAGTKRTGRSWLYGFSITCGLLLVIISHTAFYIPSLILFAALGFFVILFMINCNTAIQLATPPEYLGRIMSLYTFVFLGSAPFGSLLVSTVIEYTGTSMGLLTVGLTEILLLSFVEYKYRKQGTH